MLAVLCLSKDVDDGRRSHDGISGQMSFTSDKSNGYSLYSILSTILVYIQMITKRGCRHYVYILH